jgi:ribose/xylose/arabinose/galactoside ABC-type transport system permease subunit
VRIRLVGGKTLMPTILTAGIDLSCGAIMVFSSMVMAKTAFDQGFPGWAALVIGIVVGGLAGAFNGLLITRIKLPPFIVTLGTMSIARGAALLVTEGRPISGFDASFRTLATGRLGFVPAPVVVTGSANFRMKAKKFGVRTFA